MRAAHHALGDGAPVLETERLVLRRWRSDDLEPFAAMNADPEVMRYFTSGPLDRERSDALAHRLDAEFDVDGFGRAALQGPDGRFCGFVGLGRHARRPDDVEVGWRLARWAWGRGYATEAARAWVAAAPAHGLSRLVSYVDPRNAASVAVAQRLGMSEDHREVWDGQDVAIYVLDRLGGQVTRPRRGPGTRGAR